MLGGTPDIFGKIVSHILHRFQSNSFTFPSPSSRECGAFTQPIHVNAQIAITLKLIKVSARMTKIIGPMFIMCNKCEKKLLSLFHGRVRWLFPISPICIESERGGWGEWSEWTPCSTTCAGGTRNRYRVCDSPPPRYGALFCEVNYFIISSHMHFVIAQNFE